MSYRNGEIIENPDGSWNFRDTTGGSSCADLPTREAALLALETREAGIRRSGDRAFRREQKAKYGL